MAGLSPLGWPRVPVSIPQEPELGASDRCRDKRKHSLYFAARATASTVLGQKLRNNQEIFHESHKSLSYLSEHQNATFQGLHLRLHPQI